MPRKPYSGHLDGLLETIPGTPQAETKAQAMNDKAVAGSSKNVSDLLNLVDDHASDWWKAAVSGSGWCYDPSAAYDKKQALETTQKLKDAISALVTPSETCECLHPIGKMVHHGFVSGKVGDFRCTLCDSVINVVRLGDAQKAAVQHAPEVCGCPYGNCTCDDGSSESEVEQHG